MKKITNVLLRLKILKRDDTTNSSNALKLRLPGLLSAAVHGGVWKGDKSARFLKPSRTRANALPRSSCWDAELLDSSSQLPSSPDAERTLLSRGCSLCHYRQSH